MQGEGGASDVVPLLQSEQLSKNRQLIEIGGCEEGCFDLYVAHVFVLRVVLCWLTKRALHRKKTSALEIVRFDACKAQARARFFSFVRFGVLAGEAGDENFLKPDPN